MPPQAGHRSLPRKIALALSRALRARGRVRTNSGAESVLPCGQADAAASVCRRRLWSCQCSNRPQSRSGKFSSTPCFADPNGRFGLPRAFGNSRFFGCRRSSFHSVQESIQCGEAGCGDVPHCDDPPPGPMAADLFSVKSERSDLENSNSGTSTRRPLIKRHDFKSSASHSNGHG